MSINPVVIVAARRTPIGAFQGALSGATAPQLGATAIRHAIADAGIDAADIDQVLMGCVSVSYTHLTLPTILLV